VNRPPQADLDAARRELADLYRQLAVARPFSRSRMATHMQIARLKRRIAQLERERR
jgi:Lon protease-like protein